MAVAEAPEYVPFTSCLREDREVRRIRRPVAGFAWRDNARAPRGLNGGRVTAGPFLVPLGDRWKAYEPLRSRRLPEDWRRLVSLLQQQKDLEAIRTFADLYGFLATPDILQDDAGAHIGYGESADVWLSEARTFAAVAHLAKSEVVGEELREFVSRKLAGQFNVDLSPHKPLRFLPRTLAAAIWTDFGVELSGRSGAHRRECLYCHAVFRATRRDHWYCTDLCRSQARYQRNPRRKALLTVTGR